MIVDTQFQVVDPDFVSSNFTVGDVIIIAQPSIDNHNNARKREIKTKQNNKRKGGKTTIMHGKKWGNIKPAGEEIPPQTTRHIAHTDKQRWRWKKGQRKGVVGNCCPTGAR